MAAESLIQVNHNQCTKCGHCVAVCPNGALDYKLAPLEKQVLLEMTPMLDTNIARSHIFHQQTIE